MEMFMEKHGRPSLIHAHCARWGGAAARDLAEKYELPYVVTEHSSAYQRGKVTKWQKPIIRKCFEDAAAVWAVSNAFKQQLEPYVGDARVGVMPNMVDTDFFREPPQPRTNQPFTFLCIASLTPNKGIDVLLNSFCKAFRGDLGVRLIIGGDGPERQKLEQLTEDLRIDSQVQFYGVMSREEVRDAMWEANTLVSASYIETFGIVLIEAMATGLPVVATRSGGPQDIVRPDVGRLVPTGDSDALAEALVQIIENSFTKSAVREHVTSTYSDEAFAERLIEQYQDITQGAIK
jgi:glycosyltransferase involved in cell wall biosynthesis